MSEDLDEDLDDGEPDDSDFSEEDEPKECYEFDWFRKCAH
jgi:hypothetical protein